MEHKRYKPTQEQPADEDLASPPGDVTSECLEETRSKEFAGPESFLDVARAEAIRRVAEKYPEAEGQEIVDTVIETFGEAGVLDPGVERAAPRGLRLFTRR